MWYQDHLIRPVHPSSNRFFFEVAIWKRQTFCRLCIHCNRTRTMFDGNKSHGNRLHWSARTTDTRTLEEHYTWNRPFRSVLVCVSNPTRPVCRPLWMGKIGWWTWKARRWNVCRSCPAWMTTWFRISSKNTQLAVKHFQSNYVTKSEVGIPISWLSPTLSLDNKHVHAIREHDIHRL